MDDKHIDVPGAQDVHDVLRSDPIYLLMGARLTNPWILGVVLAIIVSGMIVLGPSTESRFIYTDF